MLIRRGPKISPWKRKKSHKVKLRTKKEGQGGGNQYEAGPKDFFVLECVFIDGTVCSDNVHFIVQWHCTAVRKEGSTWLQNIRAGDYRSLWPRRLIYASYLPFLPIMLSTFSSPEFNARICCCLLEKHWAGNNLSDQIATTSTTTKTTTTTTTTDCHAGWRVGSRWGGEGQPLGAGVGGGAATKRPCL